jgi:uncharacterized membrane protein
MDWYYVENGEQAGPISEEQLGQLVNDGTIAAATFVWNEGMTEWIEYGQLFKTSEGAVVPATAATFAEHSPLTARGTTLNADLMAAARASLPGFWPVAIGICITPQLIYMAFNYVPYVGGIGQLLLAGPLCAGSALFFLALHRRGEVKFAMLFEEFSRFGITVGAYMLMILFILLWSLLLIVPGIIASYDYAMTFYVIADDKNIGVMDSLRRSKEMMYGYRWKFVCLNFRFFGWALLSVLTFGIGFIWLAPYMSASFAAFYDDVSGGAGDEPELPYVG